MAGETIYNPKIKRFNGSVWEEINPKTTWGNISGKPSTFPPSSHSHQYIAYNDTRNTETTPTSAATFDGLRIDFKNKLTSKIPSTGNWTAVISMDAYADPGGGYPSQLGFSMSDLGENRRLYFRSPKTTTEWGAWKTLAFLEDITWGNISGKPSTFPPRSHSHQYVAYNDTRDTSDNPTTVAGFDGLRIDFKNKLTSKIPSTGKWTAVISMDAYADPGGGYPSQLGFSMSDLGENRRLYFRSPKTTTEWGAWKTLAFTDDIPNIADWAKASTKPSYQFYEISNRYEHLLDWKHTESEEHAMTPMSVALSMEHNANRLAFINGDLLTFEYSTDAGQTWADHGYSASYKSQFCTAESYIPIGRLSGNDMYTVNSRTRITLTAQDGNSPARRVYTNPKKLLINVSTSPNLYVTIEVRTGTNYLAGDESKWVYLGEYLLTGWSGWNDIPCNLGTLGGGASQPGNYWQMRLTFRPGGVTSSTNCTILGMRLIGPNLWASPSNMATNNHLYTYDMDQNAVFPNKVSATRINVGSGGSSSSDSSNSDKVTVNGGIIQINNYGKYVTVGNKNSAYAHFDTNVSEGFYFNTTVTSNGSIIPYTNNTYWLGSSGKRWAHVYTDNLNTNTIDTSGNITLKVDSGDSPSLIFQRGSLTTDIYNDWKLYDSGGHLMFDRCNNSGSWSQILKIDGDLGVYFKNNKLALLSDIPDVSALAPKNSPVFSNKITIGATEIAPANSGDISLTLPAGDGQLALKEDISGKLDKTGGTMTGVINTPQNNIAINFRSNNATYNAGIAYRTNGNEAVCFDNKQSATSWIFRTKDPISGGSVWDNVVPSLQIKNQRVTINKLIPNGADAAYNLDVNGTANATTIYENGVSLADKYQAKGSGGGGISFQLVGYFVVEDGDCYITNASSLEFPVGKYICVPKFDDSISDSEFNFVGCVTSCTRVGHVTFSCSEPYNGNATSYIQIEGSTVGMYEANTSNVCMAIYRIIE